MAIIHFRCEKCGHEQDYSITKHVKKEIVYDVSFDFTKGEFEGIAPELLTKLKKSYKVNVDQEIMKMSLWLQANPTRAKKNYVSFIQRWLERTAQKGGSIPVENIKPRGPLPSYRCDRCGASVPLDKRCSCYGGVASQTTTVTEVLNMLGGKLCGS